MKDIGYTQNGNRLVEMTKDEHEVFWQVVVGLKKNQFSLGELYGGRIDEDILPALQALSAFADVLSHRQKIRQLFDEFSDALDNKERMMEDDL